MSEYGRQLTDKARLFQFQWQAFWAMQRQTEPELTPEFKYVPGRGFRADWALPVYRIVIEVNGGIGMRKGGHNSWTGIHRDYQKARLAAANRYWFFPCSVYDLESDPVGTIRPIYELIKQIDQERG
jgi:hypothetical protein